MAIAKNPKPTAQAGRGTLRKDSFKITAENEIAEGRLKIISDLSQRQADRIVGAVQKEEQGVSSKMAQAATSGNDPLTSLIKYYQEELQDIYYSSTQETTSFTGDDPIKTNYLPRIQEIIKNISQEPTLKASKTDVALLVLANKIKQLLEKRITLRGKLKESASKFLKNDIMGQIGQSALGGIEEKAPIVAMMMRSFGNRNKKNSYAREAEAARSTAASNARYNQRLDNTSKNTPADTPALAPAPAPTPTPTATPTATSPTATVARDSKGHFLKAAGHTGNKRGVGGRFVKGAGYKGDESESGEAGGGGQDGIIKILTRHTTLLEKISGTSSDMLKFFQDQAAKAASSAEEGNLEGQAGGNGRGLSATTTKETGGSAVPPGAAGGPSIFDILKGGGSFLRGAVNLAKGAVNVAKKLGGKVLGRTTASVAGDVAGTVAKTATKEVGEEAAEAAGKKLAKAAAEAAAKQTAKKGLIKGIIGKMVPKTIGKMFGKSIPGIGLLIGGAFAVGKLMKGDWLGAGLEVAGGAGGPLTAIPATIAGLGRDVHQEAYGKYPGFDAESLANMGEIKDQVTGAVQEEVDKLTGKPKDQPAGGGAAAPPASPAPPPAPPASPAPPPAPPASPAPAPAAPAAPPAAPAGVTSKLAIGARTASKVKPIGSLNDEKQMIIAHEGIRYTPYKDSLGLWTVGVGHLIGNGKTLPPEMNREFSHDEVMAMFDKDYDHHRKAAESIPGFNKFNATGQAALTDLTFNMGPAWSRGWPNTRKAIGEGNTEGAASGLENSKWYGQVGGRAATIVSMVRAGGQNSSDMEIYPSAKPTSFVEAGQPTGVGAPNAPYASQLAENMSAQGRVATTAGLGNPSSGNGSGSGSSTNIVQGGDTIVSSGGGGSASTIIPSPSDREPSLRHSGLA